MGRPRLKIAVARTRSLAENQEADLVDHPGKEAGLGDAEQKAHDSQAARAAVPASSSSIFFHSARIMSLSISASCHRSDSS